MMERLKKDLRGRCWRKVTTYFLVCCLILNTWVPAVLALEAVDMGVNSGIISTTFGAHTIIDTDHGAIINWNNFDTIGGEIVEFNQLLGGVASSASAVLNRITSASATQFDGALNANGRVFVVNPAGIVFGSGSTVNVAQLVASGLNMSDQAFQDVLDNPANGMVFEGGAGIVDTLASIRGNSVILVGKKVLNWNGIIVPDGLLVLAAGDNVYLAQDGSHVLVEVADIGDGTADIVNRSLLNADNGVLVLAASDTFGAILNKGYINARGGTITARAARVEQVGVVDASALYAGEAGSITLTGTQEVVLTTNASGRFGTVTANPYYGGVDGNGGSITFESEGTVTLGAGTLTSARGGSASGDGGSVKITAEDFLIAGEINVSPGNTDYEPGTLEIDPPIATVANGVNAGEINTIYEQDIETHSMSGTNVIVRANAVNVQDMTDDGGITGGVGGIELHGTGATGSVSFANTDNTISTTRGNIAVTAGSGGANVGNLQTGDASSSPGQITVTTSDGGDVTTGSLLITGGLGRAEISVDASGNLTTNGDVKVGSSSAIDNVPSGQDAEAIIGLSAGGNVELNGAVDAHAVATLPAADGGVTKADIQIRGGDDVTINGALVAKAVSQDNATAYASIEVEASDNVNWGLGVLDPVADGDNSQVRVVSRTTEVVTLDGDVAQVIIEQAMLQALPDFDETHMGSPLAGNVLANDNDPGGDPITAALDTDAVNGTLTLNPDGSYDYTPNPGYVGDDTFTYTATAGGDTTGQVLVTITMTNTLPTAGGEAAATHMGVAVGGTIADNISDTDGDPLTTALVTDAVNGTLTLNPDGTYSYEPDAGYVGPDSFTYSAVDPEIGAVPAEATVTIDVTNTPPVLSNDAVTTQRNTNVGGNVLANDVDADNDPLTTALVTDVVNGTLTLNPDGTFSYTPADGFIGKDSFTYSVSDPEVGATPGQATATITVNKPSTTAPPAAPGVDVRVEPEISGIPALIKWVAEELGVDERLMDVRFANTLASARDIPPYDAYSSFKKAANVLRDRRGIHTDALAQVISEFASSAAPPTEEQMASIAEAMARNTETGNVYALAGLYLDSLAEYVTFLVHEVGFSERHAVEFVTAKYADQLAEKENVGLAAYVAARLASLYEDSID
ncbi:MAG: tandem-95 repeat protein [Phycisphaerae bacterium]|nr:tandem-95 repeat protein [Phycisphaerae bacterium]